MRQIDEVRLERDLAYRFQYLAEFIGFGEAEIQTVHAAASLLAPVVPGLVDAVYNQLQRYDATWRHFVPPQSGYEGPLPVDVSTLTQDHELIQFRKQHLQRYLVSLVTKSYDDKMAAYLNHVGKIHTALSGSQRIDVPLIQMNALLGFVADALTQTILSFKLERASEERTLRAFQKLLWIQNDLINRHYSKSAA